MKHLKKYIALICALCLIFGSLSGCGPSEAENTEEYDAGKEMVNLDSGVVAENDYFSLEWNSERAAVIVTSKKDGSVWASTPVDYLNSTTIENLSDSETMNSLLMVTCRNGEQTMTHYSATESVVNGRFSSEKIDNGIRVTFYFDEIQVIAGLDMYLEGDAFKTKIDPNAIKFYGSDVVISVTPAQFMCSVKNTPAGDKNSYIAIPSGSGALLYTDLRSDKAVRSYSSEFFGQDKSVDEYERVDVETPLNMPFFGIKNGNTALCAIVESGAESSGIETKTGDAGTGYSYISAYYNTMGYDKVFGPNKHRYQYNTANETNLEPFVIAYYSLSGDNANYTGFAKKYRKYLEKKGELKKSQDNSLLNVTLIGGFKEDDLFLGIPITKDVALTSYSDAQKILTELNSLSGGSLVANMFAYGEGGISGYKVNGGNTLTGAVGSKKDLANFLNFTNEKNIKTFFNFDSVTFAEKSKGYNLNKSSALNVIDISAVVNQYNYSDDTKLTKKNGGVNKVMVARSLLEKSTSESVKIADKYGITGVAYNTLGNYCYSDYNKKDDYSKYYPVKSKMGSDVSKIINNIKTENSKSVLIDGAFSYAAAAADIITNCPTTSERKLAFDKDVPLYQIVFQGTKANSVSAINMATNQRAQFLKAIETGSGLSFTLMANYNNELRKRYERGLNTSVYSDNKEKIEGFVNEAKDFLNSVAGSAIKSHEYIAEDVTVTTFENGSKVVVNHGDKNFNNETYGTVKAQSFVTK